jgi:hypothetical protein
MWWHKALFNVSIGNFEDALTIFDDKIKTGAQKGCNYLLLEVDQ